MDFFKDAQPTLTSPPPGARNIAPDDAAELPFVTRSIYVGVQGHVRLETQEGDIVVYENLVGTKVIRAKRIFLTGTTANAIVAEK